MMFYCDESRSKISVVLKKHKKMNRCGIEKFQYIFFVSTKSMFLDVINWPKDFSYFIFSEIAANKYPDDFIQLEIHHLESGVKGFFDYKQLIDCDEFDLSFRDVFYKTNNLKGSFKVKVFKFRDECKYCNVENK